MSGCCKKNIIKFTWRRNLIYPIQTLIWTFLRKMDTLALAKIFNFSGSILFTLIMFLAEIFTGLILYIYQKRFLEKKRVHFLATETFVYPKKAMKSPDSTTKILILIFFISYFDFIQFILYTGYLPKIHTSSDSLEPRLGGILTIFAALLCYFLLKIPIYRHQIFSVEIIAICLVIIIGTEFHFQDTNIFLTYGEFIIKFLLIFFVHFFNTFFNITEKYILEYNYMHHFKVLALQGLFGFIITLVYSFSDLSYLSEISKVYSENTGGKFFVFILLLLSYIIFCGGRNAFRIITNKLYSPMTISLTDYFLNPIYFTINYLDGDFVSGGEQNLSYFLLYLILSLIISVCGCIYNEIFIVFLCGLESDTHNQVAFRSDLNYSKNFYEMIEHEDDIYPENLDERDTTQSKDEKTEIDGYIIKAIN